VHQEIELRRIATEFLIPRQIPGFIDIGIQKILTDLSFGPNLILKGPKGAGKNINIEFLAATAGVPLLTQPCCEDTSVRDLIGAFGVEGDQVYFQLGALPAAVDVANEEGGCILLLDEINTLPPTAQKILNAMCDYRQEVSIPKIGKSFRVNPGCRIWVVGTMNPNYGGTYNLNEDFRSRFEFIEVNYMPKEKEKELLYSQFPQGQPSASERRTVELLHTLAGETRSGQMEYSLSTRDLVQFVDNFLRLGDLAKSLKLLEGKFEGEHVQAYRTRIGTLFTINLNDQKLY